VVQLESTTDMAGAPLHARPAVAASPSALALAIGLGILLPLVVYVSLALLGLDISAIMMVAAGIALLIRGGDTRLSRAAPPETSAWLAVQVVPLLVVWIWRHGSLHYLGWVLPVAIILLLYLFSAGMPEHSPGKGQGMKRMLTALIVAPFMTSLRQMATMASRDRPIPGHATPPVALQFSAAAVPVESTRELETEPTAAETVAAGESIPPAETVQEPTPSLARTDQSEGQESTNETTERAMAGDEEDFWHALDSIPDRVDEEMGGGPTVMNEQTMKSVVASPGSEERVVNGPDSHERPIDLPAARDGDVDDVVELAHQVAYRVEELARSQRSAETERIQLLERVRQLEQELQAERERAQALPTMDPSITDAEVGEILRVTESAANQPETLTALLQLSSHSPLLARVARDYARLRGGESPAE